MMNTVVSALARPSNGQYQLRKRVYFRKTGRLNSAEADIDY
jgi:hypothetical protein